MTLEAFGRAGYAALVLNGRMFGWARQTIGYEDVVAAINGKPEVLHTVTYSRAGLRSGGTLRPGESTPAETGMIINAVVTDNA